MSQTSNVRRGYCPITTEESRTNVAYGTLTTPDQVASVVLPTAGLIAVGYQAVWKESVAGAARAAVFVGGNQLKKGAAGSSFPAVQETGTGGAGAANVYAPLTSGVEGLASSVPDTAPSDDATTGQILGYYGADGLNAHPGGGPVWVFAAAGTYTVSVQFKASSGSVTAKNRKLWVWTLGF